MALSAELRAMHKIMKTLEDLDESEGEPVRKRVEAWLIDMLHQKYTRGKE